MIFTLTKIIFISIQIILFKVKFFHGSVFESPRASRSKPVTHRGSYSTVKRPKMSTTSFLPTLQKSIQVIPFMDIQSQQQAFVVPGSSISALQSEFLCQSLSASMSSQHSWSKNALHMLGNLKNYMFNSYQKNQSFWNFLVQHF